MSRSTVSSVQSSLLSTDLAIVQGYNTDILPTLLKYIRLRRSIASRSHSDPPVDPGLTNGGVENNATSPATTPKDSVYAPSPTLAALNIQSPDKLLSTTPLPPFKRTQISNATPRTPTPMSIPPERLKIPQTSREMLSHMAWLSEEILRASQEKVNLAQSAYDSVSVSQRPLHVNINKKYR